jgi:hypothetical protein
LGRWRRGPQEHGGAGRGDSHHDGRGPVLRLRDQLAICHVTGVYMQSGQSQSSLKRRTPLAMLVVIDHSPTPIWTM